jgi:hypothetical protein
MADYVFSDEMTRKLVNPTVLEEADRLVQGKRSEEYGSPEDNHDRIAALWSVLFDKEITARQVALAMVLVKVAREVHAPKRDNLVDGAAYFHIADMCQ